jgi:transcriptional regulator with XRE-family HTH domain
MARQVSGVLTVPGILTLHLDQLDMSRKELAQCLGVSVRTIHNIEHGRKRVNPRVLHQLAELLNQLWQEMYAAAEPLELTADHFSADPQAIVNMCMQAIFLNRPDILLSEHALVDPALRWHTVGNSDQIPFAGSYDYSSFHQQLDLFHQSIDLTEFDDMHFYLDRTASRVVLIAIAKIRHPSSKESLMVKSFIEFDVRGCKLRSLEAVIDTALVAEFLQSGVAPKLRHR